MLAALQVLSHVTHNGFPVYVREDDPESGEVLPDDGPQCTHLEGLILRSQVGCMLMQAWGACLHMPGV